MSSPKILLPPGSSKNCGPIVTAELVTINALRERSLIDRVTAKSVENRSKDGGEGKISCQGMHVASKSPSLAVGTLMRIAELPLGNPHVVGFEFEASTSLVLVKMLSWSLLHTPA